MREELRENMKKQTIGVEVEMNNISRKKAAMVAATFFGTGRYEYTASSDGYDTWSAWDAGGRKWKFSKDVSIVGPDSEKCELVTPILVYDDIYTLQGLVRKLREAGGRSDWSRGCGVHVHIGADGHTPATLRNLANIMAAHEDLLIDAVGVARSRVGGYCKKSDPRWIDEVNKKRPRTMDALADVWYESQDCSYGRYHHYNESRYHMINFHATFTKGTVEFRFFQFDVPRDGKYNGIHAGQLKAFIQLALAMSNYAKTVRYASPEAPVASTENPKYVMRFWLKTMGMVGDEFKTARDFYVERLEGNSDNRFGDRALEARRVAA